MRRSALVAFALVLAVVGTAPTSAQAQRHDPKTDELEWQARRQAQRQALTAFDPERPSISPANTVTDPLTLVSIRAVTDAFGDYEAIGEFRNDTTTTLSFPKIRMRLVSSSGQVFLDDYTYFHCSTSARLTGSSITTGVLPPGGVGIFRLFTDVPANSVFGATHTTSAETYSVQSLFSDFSLVGSIAIGTGTSPTWAGTLRNNAVTARAFFPEVAVAGYYNGQLNDMDWTYARSSDATTCGVTTDATVGPQSTGTFLSYFDRSVSTITRVNVEWDEVSLNPSGQSFGAGGGAGTFVVAGECSSSWTPMSAASWITVTNTSANGTVTYGVVANTGAARSGTIAAAGLVFTVTQQSGIVSNPVMSLDGPANNSTIRQPFNTGGWAVDLGAASGSGVDAIHVWAFPVVNGVIGAGQFVAQAGLGGYRPDVGAVFGSQFNNAGFNFMMTGLNPGQYYVGVYVDSSVTGTFNQQQFAFVTILGSDPHMSLDGPANNSTVKQPFNTGGWAVDLGATSGVGVDAIHVWAFPVVNGVIGAGQFVDAALLGGARSDVGAVFGSQFNNAGFNFLMTGLSPGQYYAGVYVHSTVTGTFNQQQFALITVVPSPGGFGGGQYLIGTDLPAGRYFTAPTGTSCYWERESGLGGTLGEIIANDFLGPGYAQVVVDLAATDLAFKVDPGCGTWSNSTRRGLQSRISAGEWVVGSQISPGTYRANPTSTGCYWQRSRKFSGLLSDIIANNFSSTLASQLVTIAGSDVGFTGSPSCGDWTLLQPASPDEPSTIPQAQSTEEIERNWNAHRQSVHK